MVNWKNLDTVLDQLEALLKVVHFTSGVYIWEFFSALNFEWSFLRGRRKWNWTVVLYFACRVTTLAAAVTQMTGFNFTSEISCKTWLILTRIFTNTSTTLAMALYALRSIAVWKRNDWLILFVVGCLITNVILWMRLTVKPSAYWNEETHTCIITNTYRGLPNNASMLATDVIFFVVILSGVYQRNSGKHIVITMYNEGLFWLAIATLIQLLPVIFISLDLNDVMNLMFQTPAIICAGIGATRMYRKIFDRHSGDLLEYLESSRNEETGSIRFRRQSLLVARLGHDGDRNIPRIRPRVVSSGRALTEVYVEQFGGCEIRLEGAEAESRTSKIDPDLVL